MRICLKKGRFFSIMKLWLEKEFDDIMAIHSCRKAVDAVESRYDYKGLCKRCGRVCRHFQLLYLRWAVGNPARAAYGA